MHLHKPPKNLWKSAPVFEIIYFCWTHSKCRNNRPTHFCPITQKKPKWSFVLLQFEIRQEMEQKASALITVFGVVGVLLSPSWYRQKQKAWVKTTKCPKWFTPPPHLWPCCPRWMFLWFISYFSVTQSQSTCTELHNFPINLWWYSTHIQVNVVPFRFPLKE